MLTVIRVESSGSAEKWRVSEDGAGSLLDIAAVKSGHQDYSYGVTLHRCKVKKNY
jgi:hypothetical protein